MEMNINNAAVQQIFGEKHLDVKQILANPAPSTHGPHRLLHDDYRVHPLGIGVAEISKQLYYCSRMHSRFTKASNLKFLFWDI